MSVQSISLPIEISVYTSGNSELLGIFNDPELGWIWDRTIIRSSADESTQYDTRVLLDIDVDEGVPGYLWKGSVKSGIDYLALANYPVDDYLTWTPVFDSGAYSFLHEHRRLFSDHSYIGMINPDQNQNQVSIHRLESNARPSSLEIALWTRTDDYRLVRYHDYRYVGEFTGVFSGSTRLDVEDDQGNISWGNLETRLREFIIRDNVIYLNQDARLDIGIVPNTVGDLTLLESLGEGLETGRNMYLKYFPVLTNTVRLFSLEADNTIQEWTRVVSLDFSTETDLHFAVDEDLGIVKLGGIEFEDLYLAEDCSADAIQIQVYFTNDVANWPRRGILQIGSEQILYMERDGNLFSDITRGYNSTVATSHSKGDVVSALKRGSGSDRPFYVMYTAVPRIEYEISDHERRSANNYGYLDVNPLRNLESDNIVQITSSDLNLDTIILTADKPKQGSIYGPVYYGTDITVLTAQALDIGENPVPGLDLSIQILSGGGVFHNNDDVFTDVSNSLGEIYAFYNIPYSETGIENRVINIEHIGSDTVVTVDTDLTSVDPDDILIFQILKHDSITGTVGLSRDITASAAASQPYGDVYLDIDGLLTDDYLGGIVSVIGLDSIHYVREIKYAIDLEDINGVLYTRVYFDDWIEPAQLAGQVCYLLKADAVEWDANVKNGIRVLLYEWNSQITHPVTGAAGAFYPVKPDSVSGYQITFSNRLLPLPDALDNSVNLGGYIVVAPRIVSFRAYGRDPISGYLISSNILKLEVNIPEALSGVRIQDGLPIPYGFTLVSEESNTGGGIGTPDFITINPLASGINQFNLQLNF